MQRVEYRATGIGEIDLIRPLWEQLNEHHRAHAGAFVGCYERMRFEDRCNHFHHLAESGALRLDMAIVPVTGSGIGYCISSLSTDKAGEIESLFVDDAHRSAGIGTELVTRALAWLDSRGAEKKRVSVAAGNEAAWEFYRKFGFYPRMTVLEQRGDTE